MLAMYPPIKPYAQRFVKVDSIHELYVEESGTPSGIPVVLIHDGPGYHSVEDSRRLFDPSKYRIIIYDQRGCGGSKPNSELRDNHTANLISDLEIIRLQLKVDSWLMYGDSWGAAVALLYAEARPQCVQGLITKSVMLATKSDIDWFFYPKGAAKLFPDAWNDFILHVSVDERDNLISAYHKRLVGDDELAGMSAAKSWARWKVACTTLQPMKKIIDSYLRPYSALTFAKLQTHYLMNNFFIDTNQILDNMQKIKNIPGAIIHGRYDVVSPLDNSYMLHQEWPESELDIIRCAGNYCFEPGITTAIIQATDEFARKLC